MSLELEKLSVLVVEDTEPMLKLLKSVLDTLGIGRVYCRTNAKKAFETFCQEKPDIVITDWHMDHKTGLDLTEQIRNDPLSPKKTTPVIIMTGYSALQRVAEARDHGATEFLVKPFSASALAKRIAYVINRPRDFIKTDTYFGPDRRRKQIKNYNGPKRRKTDFPQSSGTFEIQMPGNPHK